MGKRRALEDTGMQADTIQDPGQLRHTLLVKAVNPRHLLCQARPSVQDVQRRQLLFRKTGDPLIPDANQCLEPRHPEHHFPFAPGRDLLQRRFPPQGDKE